LVTGILNASPIIGFEGMKLFMPKNGIKKTSRKEGVRIKNERDNIISKNFQSNGKRYL
jgi:hypothetical protein